MKQTLFITGTDTHVGKTVLTSLLVQFLREGGVNAVALKPICSGGRDDARTLRTAMKSALTLDEINPWHFRAAIAPALAARKENKRVKLSQVLAHVRIMQKRFDVVLIEGAGGLLSPLGENFDSRDLVAAIEAVPVIVAINKLGAINHLRLTWEALPGALRTSARIVLMTPAKADAVTKTNASLLVQFINAGKIFTLPWLGTTFSLRQALKNLGIRRTLKELAADIQPPAG